MIIESNRTPQECQDVIIDFLRSGQLHGWIKTKDMLAGGFRCFHITELKSWKRVLFGRGCFFYITNRRHIFLTSRDLGLGLPIAVYCRGSMTQSDTGTVIKFTIRYGFNWITLLVVLAGNFLIFSYSGKKFGVSIDFSVLLTLGITILGYLFSVIVSAVSLLGQDDRKEIMEFLESNF